MTDTPQAGATFCPSLSLPHVTKTTIAPQLFLLSDKQIRMVMVGGLAWLLVISFPCCSRGESYGDHSFVMTDDDDDFLMNSTTYRDRVDFGSLAERSPISVLALRRHPA